MEKKKNNQEKFSKKWFNKVRKSWQFFSKQQLLYKSKLIYL